MQLAHPDTANLRSSFGPWVPGENGVAGARLIPADTSIHRLQYGARMAMIIAIIAGGLGLGWAFAR